MLHRIHQQRNPQIPSEDELEATSILFSFNFAYEIARNRKITET
jgi:hypothetical protein